MTGRLSNRNKKLVRSRRLSEADTSDESDQGGTILATPIHPAWSRSMPEGAKAQPTPKSKWKRASVRAVELQGEFGKNNNYVFS